MSSGRAYTAVSNLVTYTSTAATLVMYGLCASTNPADFARVGIGLWSGSGVSYPTNGTVELQLCRVTGTASGGTAVTPNPLNTGDVAANTTFKDASGSAVTGTTQGVLLQAWPLPFTAGANWAEWESPGFEWRVAASAAVGLYLAASSAGTNTQFRISVSFTE